MIVKRVESEEEVTMNNPVGEFRIFFVLASYNAILINWCCVIVVFLSDQGVNG